MHQQQVMCVDPGYSTCQLGRCCWNQQLCALIWFGWPLHGCELFHDLAARLDAVSCTVSVESSVACLVAAVFIKMHSTWVAFLTGWLAACHFGPQQMQTPFLAWLRSCRGTAVPTQKVPSLGIRCSIDSVAHCSSQELHWASTCMSDGMAPTRNGCRHPHSGDYRLTALCGLAAEYNRLCMQLCPFHSLCC